MKKINPFQAFLSYFLCVTIVLQKCRTKQHSFFIFFVKPLEYINVFFTKKESKIMKIFMVQFSILILASFAFFSCQKNVDSINTDEFYADADSIYHTQILVKCGGNDDLHKYFLILDLRQIVTNKGVVRKASKGRMYKISSQFNFDIQKEYQSYINSEKKLENIKFKDGLITTCHDFLEISLKNYSFAKYDISEKQVKEAITNNKINLNSTQKLGLMPSIPLETDPDRLTLTEIIGTYYVLVKAAKISQDVAAVATALRNGSLLLSSLGTEATIVVEAGGWTLTGNSFSLTAAELGTGATVNAVVTSAIAVGLSGYAGWELAKQTLLGTGIADEGDYNLAIIWNSDFGEILDAIGIIMADLFLPIGARERASASWGDPHLKTFDNLSYNFQAVGEYVYLKSTTSNFEVQVRQEDLYNTCSVSFNTAVAINTGKEKISIYANPARLILDGKPVDQDFEELKLKDQGKILKKENAYLVSTSEGDSLMIATWTRHLDIYIAPSEARKGKIKGITGNFDGNPNNDLMIDNNRIIKPDNFSELYTLFANHYKVKQETSLFTYENGKNTASYFKQCPSKEVNINDLPNRKWAEDICRKAGVTSEPTLANCILDVALTKDSSFARGAVVADKTIAKAQVDAPDTNIKLLDLGEITWRTQADQYKGQIGLQITCNCPPNGNEGSVWGTDIYTDDSSICLSAVHYGVINKEHGGVVVIEIMQGQASYMPSVRNEVESGSWGSWSGSFRIVK